MARLLVIEDEADIRQVLDHDLAAAGREVLAAAREGRPLAPREGADEQAGE